MVIKPGLHEVTITVVNKLTGEGEQWRYPVCENTVVDMQMLYAGTPFDSRPVVTQVLGAVIGINFTARPDADGTIGEATQIEYEEES